MGPLTLQTCIRTNIDRNTAFLEVFSIFPETLEVKCCIVPSLDHDSSLLYHYINLSIIRSYAVSIL
jgi:hypothetical protein